MTMRINPICERCRLYKIIILKARCFPLLYPTEEWSRLMRGCECLQTGKRWLPFTRFVTGSDPVLMLDGPIPATRQALRRSGLPLDQIDIIEINEAFASVVLAWAKEIGPDLSRVNPNGGAIALGHPLGATGAILMTKLVHELQRTQG